MDTPRRYAGLNFLLWLSHVHLELGWGVCVVCMHTPHEDARGGASGLIQWKEQARGGHGERGSRWELAFCVAPAWRFEMDYLGRDRGKWRF